MVRPPLLKILLGLYGVLLQGEIRSIYGVLTIAHVRMRSLTSSASEYLRVEGARSGKQGK